MKFRDLLNEKIPFFLLSFIIGLMTLLAQRSEGAVVSLRSESIVSRLATTLAGYWGYLWKSIWPTNLSFLYLRPSGIAAITICLASLTLLAITLAALSNLRSQRQIGDAKWAFAVGWFWFVLMLLPVSGLVQVGPQLMADRYTYLPGIGLALMSVWGMGNLCRQNIFFTRGSVGCAVAVLLAFACMTRQQVYCWTNTETLMTRALKLDPENYIAHQNLAVYFTKLGQTKQALFHRQQARVLTQASLELNGKNLLTGDQVFSAAQTVPAAK